MADDEKDSAASKDVELPTLSENLHPKISEEVEENKMTNLTTPFPVIKTETEREAEKRRRKLQRKKRQMQLTKLNVLDDCEIFSSNKKYVSCPYGHYLEKMRPEDLLYTCDNCGDKISEISILNVMYRCRICDFDLCKPCYHEKKNELKDVKEKNETKDKEVGKELIVLSFKNPEYMGFELGPKILKKETEKVEDEISPTLLRSDFESTVVMIINDAKLIEEGLEVDDILTKIEIFDKRVQRIPTFDSDLSEDRKESEDTLTHLLENSSIDELSLLRIDNKISETTTEVDELSLLCIDKKISETTTEESTENFSSLEEERALHYLCNKSYQNEREEFNDVEKMSYESVMEIFAIIDGPLTLTFKKRKKEEKEMAAHPFVGFWIPGRKRYGTVEITEDYLIWPKRYGEDTKFSIGIHFDYLCVEAEGVMHVGEIEEDCIVWENNRVWMRKCTNGLLPATLSSRSRRMWRRRNRRSWARIPGKEDFVGQWWYAFKQSFEIELRRVQNESDVEEEKGEESKIENEQFAITNQKKVDENGIEIIEKKKSCQKEEFLSKLKSYSESKTSKKYLLEKILDEVCMSDFSDGPKNELWFVEDHPELGHIEVPLRSTTRINGYEYDGSDYYVAIAKSGSRVNFYFKEGGGSRYLNRKRIVTDEPKPPTEKDLAKHWMMPPNWSDKCVTTMILCLSVFYDFSAAVISLVDVTTDVLVTREFYMEEKYFFFYFSLCIMLVAHLSFSFIFIGLYCDHTWTDKHRMMLWFAMVPFSQAVPLFIWIHSFEFEWFMDMLRYFKLNTEQPGSPNIRDDDDVLMVWIKRKFSSHGGFIAEACIEAFPQSILQMISIVVYHEHTTLNLVSVIISMSAVASKSFMLSYNIDRRVFLFNFACFVGDIFNVFATIAWVFHHDEKGVFLDSTFSWIWVYKICGLAFMILTLGILYFRRFMYDVHGHCCHTWSRTCEGVVTFMKGMFKQMFCMNGNTWCSGNDGCWITMRAWDAYIDLACYCNCGYHVYQNPCCEYRSVNACHNWCDYVLLFFEYFLLWPVAGIMFVIMATGLYVFSILGGEIFKLGFFPLMIFGAGQKHRSAAPFYRYLFSFLQSSRNTKDCKLRLALTNKHLLEQHFQECPKIELQSADELQLRHKYEQFVAKDPTEVTFSEMYGFTADEDSMTIQECLHLCCVTGIKENCCRWLRCQMFLAEECYLLTIFGPYDVLTALFTIFFPIICMIITPYRDWTLLQTTLTIIYLISFFTMLCLSIYVFKFFRLNNSIFAPIHSTMKTTETVDCTIAYWKDFIATEMRNRMIKDYFLDVAPIILDFVGQHRVYDISWVPPSSLNWKQQCVIQHSYLDLAFLKPEICIHPTEQPSFFMNGSESTLYGDDSCQNVVVELTTSTHEDEKKEKEDEKRKQYCNKDKKKQKIIKITDNQHKEDFISKYELVNEIGVIIHDDGNDDHRDIEQNNNYNYYCNKEKNSEMHKIKPKICTVNREKNVKFEDKNSHLELNKRKINDGVLNVENPNSNIDKKRHAETKLDLDFIENEEKKEQENEDDDDEDFEICKKNIIDKNMIDDYEKINSLIMVEEQEEEDVEKEQPKPPCTKIMISSDIPRCPKINRDQNLLMHSDNSLVYDEERVLNLLDIRQNSNHSITPEFDDISQLRRSVTFEDDIDYLSTSPSSIQRRYNRYSFDFCRGFETIPEIESLSAFDSIPGSLSISPSRESTEKDRTPLFVENESSTTSLKSISVELEKNHVTDI